MDEWKIGPKMAFVLRVYQMTDAENEAEQQHDREMWEAGLMSEREFMKRAATRSVARAIRHRDDGPNAWPRDLSSKPIRWRRLSDGKTGRWGELTKDSKEGETFVRVGDETAFHRYETKH